MDARKRSREAARVAGAVFAAMLLSATPAVGEDRAAADTPAKTERPTSLDRPIGLKPYLLSPPPDRLAPSDEQRAVDYRSDLQGEIKRLERRQGDRRSRRGFDRAQTIRRERARIDRVLRR